MALSSMTGFARGHGVNGTYSWAWELKSVNAKGLDLRLRLPPGWDAVEGPARNRRARTLFRVALMTRRDAVPILRMLPSGKPVPTVPEHALRSRPILSSKILLRRVEADGALEHDRLRAWPRRKRHL